MFKHTRLFTKYSYAMNSAILEHGKTGHSRKQCYTQKWARSQLWAGFVFLIVWKFRHASLKQMYLEENNARQNRMAFGKKEDFEHP